MEPGQIGQHGLHVLLLVVVESMQDHVTAAILFLSMVEIIALEKYWKSRFVIMTHVLQVRNESQTQNKVQRLAACGHVSASSQSLHFILSLRLYSSFITSRPVDM